MAEPTGPYPMRPGFAMPDFSVPEYRWVPPGAFQDYVGPPAAPWGVIRPPGVPYAQPAYAVPAQSSCPNCLSGDDPGSSTTTTLLFVGAAVALGVGAYFLASPKMHRNKRRVKARKTIF